MPTRHPSTSPSHIKSSHANRGRVMPGMRRHCRGQALVRINGRDFWLGKFGTDEAAENYNKLMQKWVANRYTW